MSYLFNCYAHFYDRFMAACHLDDLTPIVDLLRDVPPKDIADIGGGTGLLAHELFKLGHRVTIIDPCRSMTKIAQRLEPRLAIVNQPLSALSSQPTFDCLILRDCLHHLPHQQEALEKCAALLQNGGLLIIQDFVPASLASKRIFTFERFCLERITSIPPDVAKRFCEEAGLCTKYRLLNVRDYLLIARKVEDHDPISQS